MLKMVAGLVLLAGVAQAQEQAGPTEKEVGSPKTTAAGCGQYLKFTVAIQDDQNLARQDLVTFWEGPVTGTQVIERTKLRVRSVALLGAWGTRLADGYHNSAWVREFFPPERILRTRYEFDCPR